MKDPRGVVAQLRRLEKWWAEGIWAPDVVSKKTPLGKRFGIRLARTLYIVATGFRTERIKLRAAHLTYVSLLSIVPVLVVTFSLIAAFKGFSGIETALKKFFAEALAFHQQEMAIRYLDSFIKQSGALGGAGVALLVVSEILLIGNIEKSFNDIWGLRRGRSLLHRFQVYWPIVTLAPVLVGASFFLTAALETSDAVKELVAFTPLFSLVFKLLPLLLICVFLTLLYMFLPNTHVPLRAAVAGGIVAGTLWELAKQLYVVYSGFVLSSPSVYGSLAAVPLSVLWIYVSWVLALLGATLAFAIQNARTYEPEGQADRRKSQRDREFLAARLLVAVSDSFDRGAGPVPAQSLLDEVIVAPRFARRVLAELVESGLLVETVIGADEDAAYVPGRPLHTITIADIVRVMRRASGASNDVSIPEDDVLGQNVCRALLQAEKAVDEALGKLSLAEVIAEARLSRQ